MARILIAWELGANRGHIVRMLRYHDALVEAGHEVDIATQRIDGLAAEGRSIPGRLWQSPMWPRLIAWVAPASGRTPATLGDILVRMGLNEPGLFAAMIEAWRAIIDAARAEIVIGDFAPALLVAARGRTRSIAAGIGFDCPPSDMERFPSMTGEPPAHDEASVVEALNRDLAGKGIAPVASLPDLFAADRSMPGGLAEIDPYTEQRSEPIGPPLLDMPREPARPAEDEELFVYWPERSPPSAALWNGLARSGLPIRIHVPRLTSEDRAELERLGFTVEPKPLSYAEIVRRSRLLLSHGGGGFVSSGLLHGRPQVAVHFDLEKRNNGLALDRLGLGAQMPLGNFDPEAFAAGLRALHADPLLAARSIRAAGEFRARYDKTAEQVLVETVAGLLGG